MVRDSKFGNGIFVTSGEIGACAMHPPGKRIIHINKCQNRIETRGRTRRSAPTRRICPMVRDSKFGNGISRYIRRPRHARDASTAQA